jgi:hypothetical protein
MKAVKSVADKLRAKASLLQKFRMPSPEHGMLGTGECADMLKIIEFEWMGSHAHKPVTPIHRFQ